MTHRPKIGKYKGYTKINKRFNIFSKKESEIMVISDE